MSKFGVGFNIPGQVLEFINGFLFVVCIGMFLFIMLYLRSRWARNKYQLRYFLSRDEVKLAWSLSIFALGDAIIRWPVWYLRHMVNHGYVVDSQTNDSFVFIISIGTVLCSWGGLCAMRVMVPERWGNWPWLFVATTAIAFSLFMVL